MARVRFEDVDLLGALSRIVDLHTQHYKEVFDLDKELISKLAVSDRSEDKQLLWMSRPCGTYTLREREVYLDGSHENKVWRFYQEQTNDPVLAYAISLKEVRDGKIFGNLYPLNYREHVERMKKLTCPIGNVAVAFEDGNVSNKDKLDLQTVQQAEHEEKLRSIQDSKRHLYEQYALGEIDLETYRTRKAVYDTELVQAKNVHAVITAQTKQIKSDYEIKLKQQEIVQKVGNANMLTKALIDRLINKVYVFPGDRIEIEYATQDFLETKESEKEV